MAVGCHAGAENGTTWALCYPPFICIPAAVSRVPVGVACSRFPSPAFEAAGGEQCDRGPDLTSDKVDLVDVLIFPLW